MILKVPTQPPSLEGFPIWAQVLISILFGLATLFVSIKGYFGKKPAPEVKGETTTTAVVAGASLMDNMSIRALSDQLSHASNDVLSLERALNENTHWVRSKFEQDRETCQRLRELREVMERLERMAERHLK